MNNSNTPFTDVYVQFLDSFRAFIPGAGPGKVVAEKTAEVVAKQEWEDEGGSLKTVPPAKTKGAPKLRAKKKLSAAKAGTKLGRKRR
jgi:hypothetical protein